MAFTSELPLRSATWALITVENKTYPQIPKFQLDLISSMHKTFS